VNRSEPDHDGGFPLPDPTQETSTGGPSRGSTSGILDAGVRKAYEKTAHTIAKAASALIEARAGAGTGAFLMLDNEATDIAEPASRILARHAPMPGGSKATDLADVVELIVAAVGYGMNGLTRRAYASGTETIGNPSDQGEPNPPEEPPPAVANWPGTYGQLP